MQRTFYSSSNSTNTTQASVHEREKSPAEIARGRVHVVFNAVNNIFAFLPSENTSTSTVETSQETVSIQGNHNTTIAGEVTMSSEVANHSQNDPVSSNVTVDQTITYSSLDINEENVEKALMNVHEHAVSSADMNRMFEDTVLKEKI